MWRKFIFSVLVAVLVVPLLGLNSADALTISPVLIEHDVDPGDRIVGTVKLRNEGEVTETFFPFVEDFEAGDEAGTPAFIGVSDTRSLVDWVTFERNSVSIAAGEDTMIVYTINVPENAVPGGYYGGLLFSTQDPDNKEGVGVTAATGPIVLLTVEGDNVESGKIADFSTSSGTLTSLPVDFNVRFENTGTVHLKPYGEIHISSLFGGEYVVPVNTDGRNVLPESAREFDIAWQKKMIDEDSSEFVKEWKNFAFGPHTATLSLQYGQDGEVVTAATSFWVMPWMIIVMWIVVLIIVVLLIVQYNRWIVKKAGKAKK